MITSWATPQHTRVLSHNQLLSIPTKLLQVPNCTNGQFVIQHIVKQLSCKSHNSTQFNHIQRVKIRTSSRDEGHGLLLNPPSKFIWQEFTSRHVDVSCSWYAGDEDAE